MSTPISIQRDRKYRLTKLVYNGLKAQIPSRVGFGQAWSEDPDNYFILEGEMIYRLDENGISVEDACFAVYGKTIAEMSQDLWELTPKIYDYMDQNLRDEGDENVDFTTIDYRSNITVPLYPKRFFNKGELYQVEWFTDTALTDKVLCVEMNYTRDSFGFALQRETRRKWVMNNEEYHPRQKLTYKDYTINLQDQITEGKRRRENIVNNIQLPTLGAMQEVLTPMGYQPTQILLLGREVMDHLEPFFNKFIANSSTVTDLNDPNVGRKKIVVEFERLAANEYAWMKNSVAMLGGASIEQYLVNEFSI